VLGKEPRGSAALGGSLTVSIAVHWVAVVFVLLPATCLSKAGMAGGMIDASCATSFLRLPTFDLSA
jgi:hypothetical protein